MEDELLKALEARRESYRVVLTNLKEIAKSYLRKAPSSARHHCPRSIQRRPTTTPQWPSIIVGLIVLRTTNNVPTDPMTTNGPKKNVDTEEDVSSLTTMAIFLAFPSLKIEGGAFEANAIAIDTYLGGEVSDSPKRPSGASTKRS